jgi:single-strand DNA-binding protein
MFETPFHVVGNIITDPIRRRVGDQEVYKFRVASNSRRRTAEGNWEPGNSLYVSVNCWGNRLVKGVGASLGKGDPVIVVGYLYTSEYEDRDGNRRSSVEVRATAVGPDLARSIATVERPKSPGGNSDDAAETKDDESEGVTEAAGSDETVGGKALPIPA